CCSWHRLLRLLDKRHCGTDHHRIYGHESRKFSLVSSSADQANNPRWLFSQTSQEWNNCFYLAAVISTLGAVIFALYGSSEAQSWASTSPTKEERQLSEMD
ncbi:hypothetical protein U1Q18_051706, partial [Sarracenia purpurea var. burkii]